MKQNKLTVIDFFCGAGGFSEGFKQQGFDIILGIPIIISEFGKFSISPPCVSFSSSNKS